MDNWINTILENCVTALVCPRSEFYPDKNFGSHIKSEKFLLDSEKFLAFARQALCEFDGVYVKSAIMKSDSVDFLLLINDYEREVSISL